MHYRLEKAVLSGSKFGVWLARTVGVKPKIMKIKVTPEQAAKLREERHLDIQDVLPNGDDDITNQ
jgi:hypothetical protein